MIVYCTFSITGTYLNLILYYITIVCEIFNTNNLMNYLFWPSMKYIIQTRFVNMLIRLALSIG